MLRKFLEIDEVDLAIIHGESDYFFTSFVKQDSHGYILVIIVSMELLRVIIA